MSVNLQKGQKVNLSKQRYGLSKVMVGLGWDEAPQNAGLFGMFKAKPQDIDCDAFAVLLGYDGHLLNARIDLQARVLLFVQISMRFPRQKLMKVHGGLRYPG